jgi:hypothetical protein
MRIILSEIMHFNIRSDIRRSSRNKQVHLRIKDLESRVPKDLFPTFLVKAVIKVSEPMNVIVTLFAQSPSWLYISGVVQRSSAHIVTR